MSSRCAGRSSPDSAPDFLHTCSAPLETQKPTKTPQPSASMTQFF